ncbi:MAG: glycosyltransferase family 2 protein [Acidimicrobiales bacterium]
MPRPSVAGVAGHVLALAAGAWLLWDVREPGGGDPGSSGAGRRAPAVTVVVPARDEEHALPGLLRSVAAQSRPPDELVVVDDHSGDATASLAAAAGATVLRPPPIPPGWLGKPWACHHGAAAGRGDVLVFLDADVTLAPTAIERLVEDWRRTGGVLSVQPCHRAARAYEQLSAVCNVVTMMGTGMFSGPPRGRADMAFGPCLVIGREDYLRAGGHSHPAVRARVAEDVAIARRVRAGGGAVRAAAGGELVAFRMYPGGVKQLVEGWSKMLARGAVTAPAAPALATALWVTGALRATACGVRAAGGLMRCAGHGRRPPGRAGMDALVFAAWVAEMRWLTERVGRWRWWTAPAFPIPLAAFLALTLRSALLLLTGRPAVWRGRKVPA